MFTLKKLHLENFMIVDELDLEFENNQITAITGDNGNGKSTIFYAIAYCLTGYRKGDTFKNYIKTGNNYSLIQLDAYYKGKPIKYDITITDNDKNPQSTKKVVTYNGVTYINSEYNAFMKAENLEELETVTFMFQGNSSLTSSRPSERANLLKRIFKSEFPEQVSSCKDNIDKTKINTAELNAIVEELKTHTFNPVSIFREASDSYIEECKTKLQESINKINQIGNIDASEINACESKLTACQKQINETTSKIQSDEISLESNKTRLKDCISKLNSSEDNNLEEHIESKKKEIAQHAIDYDAQKKEHRRLKDELNLLEYKKKELEGQYEISKTGVCHACGQPIEESHVTSLKTQLDQVDKDLSEVNKQISELNYDSSDMIGKNLKKELEGSEKLLLTIKQLRYEKTSLEEKISDTERNLSDRKNYLEILNTQKEELLKSKKEISKILPLLDEKESLLKEKKSLEESISSANEVKIKNIERREANRKLEEEKQACEKRITELSDKINTLTVENAQRKVLLDIFETQLPNYIVVKMCDKLSDFINITIQKVFPYCKVKLLPSKSGVGFFYTTESSEDEYLPISMASGAQEKILNLAYFVALAKLSGINCVFLDEIDASCSPNSAKEIYDFVGSLDCFSQIFFISHRDEAIEAVKAKNEKLVTYVVTKGNYNKL